MYHIEKRYSNFITFKYPKTEKDVFFFNLGPDIVE
jgi:hypothetical protein